MDATVTIATVRDIGPGTVAIKFETPDGFETEPGQFVKFFAEVNGESYAWFYMLPSPDVGDMLEVTAGTDPEGTGPFSQHPDSPVVGDDVEISGPFRQSYYDGESRVVIFAGGPGVGPAIGIAEAAVADDNGAAVVHPDDAPAHEEQFSELRDDGTNVVATGDESDFTNAVTDTFIGNEGEQLFVYGFADFVSRATDAVGAAGGDADVAKVGNFG